MSSDITDKSYRYAVEKSQGNGFSENSGTDWVFPPAYLRGMYVFDVNNIQKTIILDNSSGLFFDISGRESPTGSGVTPIWKDKVLLAGTGGTDVVPSITFPEDVSDNERDFISHLESHIYLRPYDESKRSATGYDSSAYPTGLNFDLTIYEDGNTTAKATADNIPKTGDISFDKFARAHRLGLKITANMGNHIIKSREQVYKVEDIADTPTNRTTSEKTYQAEFATPSYWLFLNSGTLLNRASGNTVSITYSAAIDPIAGTRAIRISAATSLGTVTFVSGALLLWYSGTIAITIGGAPVSLTTHSTSGGFTLAYVNALTASGEMIITPTGNLDLFDLRMFYTSAISTAARGYYFTDIDSNDGGVFLPC